MAKIAILLTRLTEKKSKWNWGKEKRTVFHKIKNEFIYDEWLSIFNSEEYLIIEINALKWVIVRVLQQKERFLEIYSRRLSVFE